MSMYPSLEDMKVDQLTRAQIAQMNEISGQLNEAQVQPNPAQNALPYPIHPPKPYDGLYPSLNDYMGLELTPELYAQFAVAVPQQQQVAIPASNGVATVASGLVAPLSGSSLGLRRAEVTHGIREVVLCKDAKGKIGVKAKDVNKGVFVILVQKGSPAALAGLRFGDQILQVNGENVAGFDADKMHSVFKKCPTNNIVLAIRDRPFERTITMHKDSVGHIGFMYKNGKIISIVKDSSAARNGVLIEHHLLEVNGQNVVGLKDKEITEIVKQGGQVVTITIMPSFIYEHMMKNIAPSLIKSAMDHSIKDL